VFPFEVFFLFENRAKEFTFESVTLLKFKKAENKEVTCFQNREEIKKSQSLPLNTCQKGLPVFTVRGMCLRSQYERFYVWCTERGSFCRQRR
jgi:hypothetical protein